MPTRDAWRTWLHAHHDTADAMWLVFPRKALGEPTVTYDEAVEEALCVGWIDGVLNALVNGWFAIRFTPRKPKSLWSKLNVQRVARMEAAGRMHPRGRAVYDAAVASGAVAAAYAVSDPVEMPAELAAALRRHRKAARLFDGLTESQRRMWMRFVLSVKRPESRRQKAADVVALILAGRRPGETDAQAARRGIRPRADILGRT